MVTAKPLSLHRFDDRSARYGFDSLSARSENTPLRPSAELFYRKQNRAADT